MRFGCIDAGNNWWVAIDDVALTIDGVLIGDLNGDGLVNLLDVEPFIDSVSSGEFTPAADINEDGIVNLLDVSPFILLLSS